MLPNPFPRAPQLAPYFGREGRRQSQLTRRVAIQRRAELGNPLALALIPLINGTRFENRHEEINSVPLANVGKRKARLVSVAQVASMIPHSVAKIGRRTNVRVARLCVGQKIDAGSVWKINGSIVRVSRSRSTLDVRPISFGSYPALAHLRSSFFSSSASRSSSHCVPSRSMSAPMLSQKHLNRARSNRRMIAVNRTSSSGRAGFPSGRFAMFSDSKTCAVIGNSITRRNTVDNTNPPDTIGCIDCSQSTVARGYGITSCEAGNDFAGLSEAA